MFNIFSRKKLTPAYFAKNFSIAIGLVLIWRGIWYILDGLDQWFFGGSHALTALGGIIIGIIILYLPDKDLRNLERL